MHLRLSRSGSGRRAPSCCLRSGRTASRFSDSIPSFVRSRWGQSFWVWHSRRHRRAAVPLVDKWIRRQAPALSQTVWTSRNPIQWIPFLFAVRGMTSSCPRWSMRIQNNAFLSNSAPRSLRLWSLSWLSLSCNSPPVPPHFIYDRRFTVYFFIVQPRPASGIIDEVVNQSLPIIAGISRIYRHIRVAYGTGVWHFAIIIMNGK